MMFLTKLRPRLNFDLEDVRWTLRPSHRPREFVAPEAGGYRVTGETRHFLSWLGFCLSWSAWRPAGGLLKRMSRKRLEELAAQGDPWAVAWSKLPVVKPGKDGR